MRYLTGRTRTRDEVLDEWLPALSREVGPDGVLGYWAGFRRDDWSQTRSTGPISSALGTKRQLPFAGWWALNPDPDDERRAELGYRLRRDQWGRGLASEGAVALLEHGFETVGLDRIWAQTMAVNAGSVGVMTRIGMRFERTWVGEWNKPLPGWQEGEVEYSVTREEWRVKRDTPKD